MMSSTITANHMKNTLTSLRKGDVIDIVAPAAKCHPDMVEKVKAIITSWGLSCHVPENLFGDSLLFSNSDEVRFQQLVDALSNTKSKAVWCLLGGYGSGRLIPRLKKLSPITQSKIFMGFSDITALHIFLQNEWKWTTLHTISARQAALQNVSEESITMVKDFLFDHRYTFFYDQLQPLNQAARSTVMINAPIIGGNLHLIQSSIGTHWQINTKDKILLIEDVNERAYRVDRVLEHLKQAGLLENIRAMLVGDFTGGEEANGTSLINETLHQFAEKIDIPVIRIPGIGHGSVNKPLILGRPALLKTSEKYSDQLSLTLSLEST